MAVAERPIRAQSAPREPVRRRKELHLLVGVVVAILTVFFAAQRATDGARGVLDERLLSAGAGANAGIVDVESEQLAVARAVSFTSGVAQDVAARDARALDELVAPLQANSTVPMVDVVLPGGHVLLAAHANGAPHPVRTYAGFRALAWSLEHASGTRGGRLSQVVVLRSGATLLTISPIVRGTEPVGAVLAMTPLSYVLGRLSQEVGADLTAYDRNGDPLDTTAVFQPRPLEASTAQALLAGGAVETRYVSGNDREKLGRLIVDHTAEAVLGVSLPDTGGADGRTVGIYVAIGLLCTALAVATLWARVANAPRRR